MSTSSLRRQVKNIVHNYSEAEIKVREATSNDPWGPSSSLMCEIADLTYNVVAFSEIMGMLWRRLNDHGKNWRHVYKALTLAEYLIKTGSERVAQQCRENIYAVQTLKDFQYIDRDGKDQGVNVREKAKQLVVLLKDEEKLKEERGQALKTKEKLAQVATATVAAPSAPTTSTLRGPVDIEQAWPQSTGEEELQLQLALAMSKEEADQATLGEGIVTKSISLQKSPPAHGEDLQMQLALSLSKEEHDKEERLRRGDDLRLQMAIEESQKQNSLRLTQDKSSLVDLADVFVAPAPPAVVVGDPWAGNALDQAPLALPVSDPWGAQAASAPSPWGGVPSPAQAGSEVWPAQVTAAPDSWDVLGSQTPVAPPVEPWGSLPTPQAQPSDPWAPVPASTSPGLSQGFGSPWETTTTPPNTSQAPAGKLTSDLFVAPDHEDDFSEFDSLRPPTHKLESAAGQPDLLAGEVPLSRADARSPDLFNMSGMGGALPDAPGSQPPLGPTRKTPESFLGPNAALVDLDTLLSKSVKASNPFLTAGGPAPPSSTNPFGPSTAPVLTLNQLRASPVPSPVPQPPSASPLAPALSPLVAPLPPGVSLTPSLALPSASLAIPPAAALPGAPVSSQNGFAPQPSGTTNPFLL